MKRVYVSGPYSVGDPEENVRNAINAGNRLFKAGFAPFIPHLSHYWHAMTPKPWEDWIKLDLALLPAFDILLRIEGESRGADLEVATAEKLGIKIYYSTVELLANEKPNSIDVEIGPLEGAKRLLSGGDIDKSPQGLSKAEAKCMDSLVAAWNSFLPLGERNKDDMDDFRRAIHECQRILAMRIVRRHNQEFVPNGE